MLGQSSEQVVSTPSFPPPVRSSVLCQLGVGQEQQSKRPCFQSPMLRQTPNSYSGLHQTVMNDDEHQEKVSESSLYSISGQGQEAIGYGSSQVQSQRHLPEHNSRVPDYSNLARSILASRVILPLPDLLGRCEGWSCSETFCSMGRLILFCQVVEVGVLPSQCARC